MAHIELRRNPDGLSQTLVINGVDFSQEVFAGSVELFATGHEEWDEIGLRIGIAVSRLDLDGDTDVEVTDHMDELNERIRAIQIPDVDRLAEDGES